MNGTVIIFNEFFSTAGGGERSCLAFAKGFESLGFNVKLVSTGKSTTTLSSLSSRFCLTLRTTDKIEYFDSEEHLCDYIVKTGPACFVNHSFSSSLISPVSNSIYVLMFPKLLPEFCEEFKKSYCLFICNSRFTDHYLKRYWGSSFPSCVLVPPIPDVKTGIVSSSVFNACKEKNILMVGRFDLEGHNKCQLEAIQTFRRMLEDPSFSDWSMKIIGSVGKETSSIEYYNSCMEAADNLPVQILLDVDYTILEKAYSDSFCFWQCTGMHLPAGMHPELCEHLGLAAIDALAYGTIPVVYQRSGAALELAYGKNGFFFSNCKELLSIMGYLNSLHPYIYQELMRNLLIAAGRFSFTHFTNELKYILERQEIQP